MLTVGAVLRRRVYQSVPTELTTQPASATGCCPPTTVTNCIIAARSLRGANTDSDASTAVLLYLSVYNGCGRILTTVRSRI